MQTLRQKRSQKRPPTILEVLEDRRLLIATTIPYYGFAEFNQFSGETPCAEGDTNCTNTPTALGIGVSDGVGGLSSEDEEPGFIGFEFDPDPFSLGGITDPGPFGGQWGLEGNLDASGRLGVEYGYYVNAGQAVIDTQGEFAYEFIPQTGGQFLLDAHFAADKKSIKTISPTLSAYADLVIEAQGTIGGEACFYACIDGEKSFNFSEKIPLLSINRQEGSVAPNSNQPPVFDNDIKLLGSSLSDGLDLYGIVNDAKNEIFDAENEITEAEAAIRNATTELAKAAAENQKSEAENKKATAEQNRDNQVDSVKNSNPNQPDVEIDKPSAGLDVDVSLADNGLLGLQVDVSRSLSLGDLGISQDLGSLAVTVPEVNLFAESDGISPLHASTTDDSFDRSKNLLAELDLNLGTLLGSKIPFIGAAVGNFSVDIGPLVSASLTTVEYTVDADLRVEQDVAVFPNFFRDKFILAIFDTEVVLDPLTILSGTAFPLFGLNNAILFKNHSSPLLSFPENPDEVEVAFFTREEFYVTNDLALNVGVDGILTALEANIEALGQTIGIGPLIEFNHPIVDYTSPSFSFDPYFVNVGGTTPIQTVNLKSDVAVSISSELAAIVDDVSFPNSHKKFEFEVRVANDGGIPATNVSIDVSNLNLQGSLTAPGCTVSLGIATCSVGTLAAGASQTFEFSGVTTLSGGDTYAATATVTSDFDTNSSNNTAQTDIPVRSSRRFYVGSAGDSSPISGFLSNFTCPLATSTCTLRQAIDAAEDHAGPSIVVIPESIPFIQLTEGDINLVEPLVIEGAGSDKTTIRAKQPSGLFGVGSRIFEISSGAFPWQSDSENEFLIKGVRLTDGKTSAVIGTSPGGAISINGGALTIEDVIFDNNETEDGDGGAIRAQNSFVVIRDSKFIDNQAVDFGGAIHIDGGTVSISDAEFTGNSAQRGGAIYVESNALVPISDAVFTQNGATIGGIIEADTLSPAIITTDEIVAYNNVGPNFLGSQLSTLSLSRNSVSDDSSLIFDPLTAETLNSRNVESLVALSRNAVLADADGADVGSIVWQLPGREMSFPTTSHPQFEVVDGVLKLKAGQSLTVGTSVNVTVTGQDEEGLEFSDTVTVTALALPPEMTSADYTVQRNVASLLFGESIVVDWNDLPNVDQYHLTVASSDGSDVRTVIIANESGSSTLSTEVTGLRHNTAYSISFDTFNAVGFASDGDLPAPPPPQPSFATQTNYATSPSLREGRSLGWPEASGDGEGEPLIDFALNTTVNCASPSPGLRARLSQGESEVCETALSQPTAKQSSFADFLELASNYGTNVEPQTSGDLDGTGFVDFTDFLILTENYSTSVSLPAPPPPATNITTIFEPPADVRGVVATATTDTISISWNESSFAYGYAVFRDGVAIFNHHFDEFGNSCTAGTSGCTIATTNLAGNTSISFPATPDTLYQFEVQAINGSGEESATFKVRTPKLSPTAPQNLTLTELSPTSVRLDWLDSDNETQYRIVEPTLGTVGDRTVGTVAANSTTFTVTGLIPGASYDFTVIAENESDAAYSAAASLTRDTIVVSALGDVDDGILTPGNLTLREAVGLANANPNPVTITFDEVGVFATTQSIVLTGQLPKVTNSVFFKGLGADKLAIDANGTGRVFELGSTSAATFTIKDLSLVNGSVPRGSDPSPDTGGILKIIDNNDTLVIDSVLFANGQANGGGAIAISGSVDFEILNSSFVANTANFSGSAVFVGGNGTGLIGNSTFAQNTSLSGVGAVHRQSVPGENGTLRIVGSTINSNTGAGISNFSFSGGTSTIEVGNTIVSANSAANATTAGAGDVFTSLGFNISDDGTTLFGDATDQTNTDPLLGTMSQAATARFYFPLQASSPAIDAGSNALAVDADGVPFAFDQRGFGFPRIENGTVDIGAFELTPILNVSPVITSDGGGDTATASIQENRTDVTNVDATDDSDSEGSGLTYSLTTNSGGGADNSLFTLNANTGALSFTVEPDFENPQDIGGAVGDNFYEAQVTVTDSLGATDTQDITVEVRDVTNASPVWKASLADEVIDVTETATTIDVTLNGVTTSYQLADIATLEVRALNGNDTVRRLGGTTFTVLIKGGNGDDVLEGNGAIDHLFGNSGRDLIKGGGGDDFIDGGIGFDTLRGGNGNDTIVGNKGNDRLFGQNGDDILTGNEGTDILVGGNGNDTISGEGQADVLIGGAGVDILSGNNAGDLLIGAATSVDNISAQLDLIMAEWKSGNGYNARVNNLIDGSGTTGGGANGTLFLPAIIIPDTDDDELTGNASRDYFWGLASEVQDLAGNELLDN